MKIDLASQAKAAGVKRKHIELREIETTQAQERDLARLYVAIVRVWAEGARDLVMPTYRRSLAQHQASDGAFKDSAQDIEMALGMVEDRAVRATFSFRNLFKSWAERLVLWHTNKIVSNLKYAANVDLSTQITAGETTQTIEDIVARNVALVRDISDEARGRISDIVFRGLQERKPTRDVAREINAAVQLGRDRSLRVAMDQTQKLSAQLDQERQEQLGITEFIWIHSDKKNFRPEHKERDGKTFAWNSEVGQNDPPGRLPFCGCKAKGVINLDEDDD